MTLHQKALFLLLFSPIAFRNKSVYLKFQFSSGSLPGVHMEKNDMQIGLFTNEVKMYYLKLRATL